MSAESPIQSPCVNICSIHQETGWCHGCGRTVVEIMDWATASRAFRTDVMAELPDRMKQLPKKDRRITRRRASRSGS